MADGRAFAQSAPADSAAKASDAPAPAAPPSSAAVPLGPQLPPPVVDVEALRAAERAEREAAMVRAAREEAEASLNAEILLRANETADLRATVETLKEQAAASAKAAADMPSVRAARLGLGLTGYVQADLAFRQSSEDQINTSTGNPLNENRFMIRRARLRATLDRTYVAGLLELDANTVNGPQARIAGAEASLRLPGPDGAGSDVPLLMATIGLFKIPFGWEVIESDRERLFLERSTTERALFPGEYDVGARLQGGWRFLRYALAAMNGDPIGERAFPVREPNHQHHWVGRLGIDGGEGPWRVVAGFSGLYGTGFHKGTPATKPGIQWIDSNEDGVIDSNELRPVPGRAAEPSINFPRHALGADLLIAGTTGIGRTTAYGEIYYARDLDRTILPADPTGAVGAVGRSYRELGWYVALMQDIGPHATIGARYDYYNPDRDASDRQIGMVVPNDASYSTLALVGALRSPSGRLIVEYDINRNHLGRAASGLPTNLRDNVFAIRGEASF